MPSRLRKETGTELASVVVTSLLYGFDIIRRPSSKTVGSALADSMLCSFHTHFTDIRRKKTDYRMFIMIILAQSEKKFNTFLSVYNLFLKFAPNMVKYYIEKYGYIFFISVIFEFGRASGRRNR